jgi:hypothetical protein
MLSYKGQASQTAQQMMPLQTFCNPCCHQSLLKQTASFSYQLTARQIMTPSQQPQQHGQQQQKWHAAGQWLPAPQTTAGPR